MRTALLLLIAALPVTAAEKDERIYYLEVNRAIDGKIDLFLEKIRDQKLPQYKRLGAETIGVFVPADNPHNRVYVLRSHKSRKEADAFYSSVHYMTEDEKKVYDEFKAKHGEVQLPTAGVMLEMTATDFSPGNFKSEKDGRVFELRTYVATPGKLGDLHARFRDHTMKLFEKHGMTNIAYFQLNQPEGYDHSFQKNNGCMYLSQAEKGKVKAGTAFPQLDAANALVYLLAHKDQDAAKKSFDALRLDPDWVKVKDASEKKAGGSLTVKDGAISLFLKPVEISPLK